MNPAGHRTAPRRRIRAMAMLTDCEKREGRTSPNWVVGSAFRREQVEVQRTGDER